MTLSDYHLSQLRTLRAAVDHATADRTRIVAERDDVIRHAHTHGASLRVIAAEAGISFARVGQIIHETEETTP